MSDITQPEQSYFEKRMQLLGITPATNFIGIRQTEVMPGPNQGNEVIKPFPIFTETERGIDILVYSIRRHLIRYASENQKHKNHIYKITRLEIPVVNKKGEEAKYLMPKGQATQPFFPPWLIEKYDDCCDWKEAHPGEKLPAELRLTTLFMTEGHFKAFKACMHGIPCVGISSITHMKNKETGTLHEDIQSLLIKCEVERFVWLTDGDCRDITSKELKEEHDLYQRPLRFFKTVSTFYDLLSPFEDLKKYFAHIPSEELEGKPKGLDDLLCAFPDAIADIVAEFNDFSRKEVRGEYNGNFIYRRDISHTTGPVYRYFHLNDVDDFYLQHVQKRPEMADIAFKFNGTMYKYDEEQAKCLVKIPGAAERYFRVGDDYYEWIHIPNKFAEAVKTYRKRQKTTITDDHGKKIIDHIVKYHDFCCVPDHINYQPVIDNCFNRYVQLPHELAKGDCSTSLAFIKHIFGDKKVMVDNGDGAPQEVEYWQLGLDYITILFKYPQQVLPILCLVSNENNTGKSTFLDWLNFLFVENMVQVGNEDLANPFNSYWTSKLIVACDETKVDKQLVFEKIKRLSTSGQNISNGKGTNQEMVESFLKFIFCSNNEDSFVNISVRDIRFWVIKVKPFTSENTEMRAELKEEIEAFLHYIYNRQMVTKKKARHWFDTPMLRTEALQKLIDNSKTGMEKRIRSELQELFEMCDKDSFEISLEGLSTDILKKADKNYVKRTLHDMGYTTLPSGRIKYPRRIERTNTTMGESAYKIIDIEYIAHHGTYYRFERKDFTDQAGPTDDDVTLLPVAVGTEKSTLPF